MTKQHRQYRAVLDDALMAALREKHPALTDADIIRLALKELARKQAKLEPQPDPQTRGRQRIKPEQKAKIRAKAEALQADGEFKPGVGRAYVLLVEYAHSIGVNVSRRTLEKWVREWREERGE